MEFVIPAIKQDEFPATLPREQRGMKMSDIEELLKARIEELMVFEKDADHYRKLAEDRFDKCMAAKQRIEELEAQVAALEAELDIAIDNQEMK